MWFSKYLKWLNLPPSPQHLTQIKPDVIGVEVKNGRVHPIGFCDWPSKIFHTCSFLRRKLFTLNLLLKTYYSIDPFYHGFLKKYFDKCFNTEELSKQIMSILSSFQFYIYKFTSFLYTSLYFFCKHTYAKTDNASFFISIRRN